MFDNASSKPLNKMVYKQLPSPRFTDSTDPLDTLLTLSLSLSVLPSVPYQLSLLVGPLDSIQCSFRAGLCNFLLFFFKDGFGIK